MNKMLLKYYMAKNGENEDCLSKALGMHKNTLSAKLNNPSRFTWNEMNDIRCRYSLNPSEFCEVFFGAE